MVKQRKVSQFSWSVYIAISHEIESLHAHARCSANQTPIPCIRRSTDKCTVWCLYSLWVGGQRLLLEHLNLACVSGVRRRGISLPFLRHATQANTELTPGDFTPRPHQLFLLRTRPKLRMILKYVCFASGTNYGCVSAHHESKSSRDVSAIDFIILLLIYF